MKYVKEWIAARLNDQKFRESLRSDYLLDSDDERMREFGGFDWKYLGIHESVGVLEFNRTFESPGGWNVDRIHSVEIWLGRKSIVIRLSPDMEREWTPEVMARLKPVGEDVFVNCGGGVGPD
jgi:hypothetical protein